MRALFYSAVLWLAPPAAWAQSAVEVSGYVNLDFASNPAEGRVYELDKTHLDIDADLEAWGWRGASAHGSLLNASGDLPNLAFGTLQGFDNIEVADRRFRVYEAWLQQAFAGGRASIRAGLYDLNSEFYVTGSSGVFLAPAYGIGSELAATGSGGPSIYPSTALAVRVRFEPTQSSYAQVATLNAKAGSIGERGGVDTGFDEGVINIGEAGWTGRGLVAVGAWSYSKHRPDLWDLQTNGDPVPRRSNGGYILLEHPLRASAEGADVTGFVRAGISDGDTGPFEASWQAGVVVEGMFRTRPEAVFAAGASGARLGPKFRAASAAAGAPLGGSEGQLEVTYWDRLTDRLTIQPNVQYVMDPGGDREAKDIVILTLRLTAEF